MGFDIDAFLNSQGVADDDFDVDEPSKKVKPYRLEFEHDVKSNLDKAKQEASTKGISTLQQIYQEILAFDEDLAQKFLGVEQRASDTLKDLGTKYSTGYIGFREQELNANKKKMQEAMQHVKDAMQAKAFGHVFQGYEEVLKLYEHYGEEFLDEKTIMNDEIRRFEVELFGYLDQNMHEIQAHVRIQLNTAVQSLQTSIANRKVKAIEAGVTELKRVLHEIPQYLFGYFLQEQARSSRLFAKAQRVLLEFYTHQFDREESRIKRLLQEFHVHKKNNDVSKCLIVYEESLLAFKSLPELFVARKVEVYRQLVNMYSSMSNVIVEHNVTLFLESYARGKYIDEIDHYLSLLEAQRVISLDDMRVVVSKMKLLPQDVLQRHVELVHRFQEVKHKYYAQNPIAKPQKSLEKTKTNGKKKKPVSFNAIGGNAINVAPVQSAPTLEEFKEYAKDLAKLSREKRSEYMPKVVRYAEKLSPQEQQEAKLYLKQVLKGKK